MWGATNKLTAAAPLVSFNPRTRVGCDFRCVERRADCFVSIHAPVWGATTGYQTYIGQDGKFQSTHPCGVRLNKLTAAAPLVKFQSTHPCGVRPNAVPIFAAASVFQSTHPCGVRQRKLRVLRGTRCFNPRTRVGCDCYQSYKHRYC